MLDFSYLGVFLVDDGDELIVGPFAGQLVQDVDVVLKLAHRFDLLVDGFRLQEKGIAEGFTVLEPVGDSLRIQDDLLERYGHFAAVAGER